MDGLGAQARQAGGVQRPPPRPRRRDELHRHRRRFPRGDREATPSATCSRSTPTRGRRPTARGPSSRPPPTRSTGPTTRPPTARVTQGYGVLQPRVSISPGERATDGLRPHLRGAARAWTRTRRPSRTRTWTSSARGSTRGRGSMMSTRSATRWAARCPRTRFSRTTCWRATTPAPRSRPASRCSTTSPRATPRSPRGCTAGCAATGSSSHGCSRACEDASRPLAPQPALRRRPVEALRQPSAQPHAAGDSGLPASGVDGPARARRSRGRSSRSSSSRSRSTRQRPTASSSSRRTPSRRAGCG